MNPFYQVFLAGAGTFVIRISAIALIGDRQIPIRVARTLTLIAPAVLSAIVANSLLLHGKQLRGIGSWHGAALIAIIVALRTKSLGWTLAAGLPSLWLIQALT